MTEVKKLDLSLDKEILPKIARLKKIATSLQDDYLLGFTYYYSSYAQYYLSDDRNEFTKDLAVAVPHLMKADDHELLARVFNMVAIDTFTNGYYNVSYNYYMHALREAEAFESTNFCAVIETNLALIFMELGDHAQGMKHIRNAIRLLRTVENKEAVRFSLHAAYVDEAIILLEQGKNDAAEKSFRKALQLTQKREIPDEDLRLSLTMIRLRFALIHHNLNEAELLLENLITYFRDEPYLSGYTSDICHLCRWLLKRKHLDYCTRIIDAVQEAVLLSGMDHLIRMFTILRADVAEAAGLKSIFYKSLLEQEQSLQEERPGFSRIQEYTLRLVHLENDIRNAQLKTSARHARLQKKAYHDALTGIANRHMLNKMLASSFDRAQEKKTLLGICILDIDSFKEYNDHFGHPEGDKCLVQIAKAIEESGVFCARYGGDEFVMIFEGMERKEMQAKAEALAARIKALRMEHPASPFHGIVTVSQGLCIGIPAKKHKIWDYMSEADAALYEVKQARAKKPKKNGIQIRNLQERNTETRS